MFIFNFNEVCIIILLFSFGVLPAVLGVFGASSMAEGVVLSIFISFLALYKKSFDIFVFSKKFVFCFLFFVIYILLCNILIGSWSSKANFSAALVFFIFQFAYFFSKNPSLENGLNKRVILIIFAILVCVGFINVLTEFSIGKALYDKNKVLFPFGEPSHYALFFGPFFITTFCHVKRIGKIIILVLVSLLALKIESSTIFIYLFLALLLMARGSIYSFFVFTPVIFFVLYFLLQDDYYLSRVSLSSDSTNLTALVYLQGLQDAYNSFMSTSGVGLGFQMLGTQPISFAGLQIGYLMGGEYLNRQDGGFLAAKLIAEFGLFGFFILILYMKFFVKSYFILSDKKGVGVNCSFIFCLSCVYCAFVEFFVRGVGYFSPTIFFMIVSIFFLRRMSWGDKFFIT